MLASHGGPSTPLRTWDHGMDSAINIGGAGVQRNFPTWRKPVVMAASSSPLRALELFRVQTCRIRIQVLDPSSNNYSLMGPLCDEACAQIGF